MEARLLVPEADLQEERGVSSVTGSAKKGEGGGSPSVEKERHSGRWEPTEDKSTHHLIKHQEWAHYEAGREAAWSVPDDG